MSNRLLTQAWNTRELTPAEKCVLARLADRANDKDARCFPGHESLAEDCGITERHAGNVVKSLHRKGHVTVVEISRRSSGGSSRFEYIVHPKTPEAISGVTPENRGCDTGNDFQRHRKIVVATPENRCTPILTSTEPTTNPKGTASGQVSAFTSTERIILHDELKDAQKELQQIRNTYEGMQTWSDDDRERAKKLKSRIAEIKQMLGIQI